MKDLRVADIILNIKLLINDNGGIVLLHSYYMEMSQVIFGYSDLKSSLTPYDPLVWYFERMEGLSYPRVLHGYNELKPDMWCWWD